VNADLAVGISPKRHKEQVFAMQISRSAHIGLSVSVAAALLAGCGSASSLAPPGAADVAPSTSNARPLISMVRVANAGAVAAQTDRGPSWMDPDVKRKPLTYIADQGTNDVYVYADKTLVGTLTGLNEPSGECVDKAGNVFVTNFGASTIVEFAHGGAAPIATLDDTGFLPLGCSVDPTTGNLGVTDRVNSQFQQGDVAVYPNAQGTPTRYTNPSMYYYEFCGYDDKGNLFLDGSTHVSAVLFAELPAGGSSLELVTLNRAIGFPGGVQWDGKHVAVGDQNVPVIYQFAISGSGGTEAGSTTLAGGSQVTQFWIQGRGRREHVIGPNAGGANTMFWKYPAGGNATKTIVGHEPVGVTVSPGS
jgi:hypothetical protein